MFYGHADNVAFLIDVNIDILTYLFSLMYDLVCEFYVSSVRILKIFQSHILFPLL